MVAVWALQVAAEDHEGVETLKRLLRGTASTYRTLLEHAQAAGIDVPEEAVLGTAAAGSRGPPPLKWNEHAASHAVDWEDFVDAGGLRLALHYLAIYQWLTRV